jgi:hypothetical protein
LAIGFEGDAEKALADDDAHGPFKYRLACGVGHPEFLADGLLDNVLDFAGAYSRDGASFIVSAT